MSPLLASLAVDAGPAISIGLCLLAIPLIALLGKRPNPREAVSLAVASLNFVLVLWIYGAHQAGETIDVELLRVTSDLRIAFKVDDLGLIFALTASGLWILNTLYSIGYMRAHDEHKQTRFYICFAAAIAAAMGAAFSSNLFSLFVFYEALTLVTYPLVIHTETPEAKAGARRYLIYLLGLSIAFQLPAIFLTADLGQAAVDAGYVTGALDFHPRGLLSMALLDRSGATTVLTVSTGLAGFTFILFLFGIGKAALMPFHSWLPAAMVAPTPVSALLHAVAVVKAGVFTVSRVVFHVFGVELLETIGTYEVLVFMACFTIVTASLIALAQDNLKRRLAYSTIAQLSYVLLGVGLLAPQAQTGGLAHIGFHAAAKITLFFCAGAIMVAAHKKRVSELDGIGRRMPITMAAFTIGALSMIGLPPTAGIVGKLWMGVGAGAEGRGLVLAVLVVSTMLNAAYFLPIVWRAFFKPTPDGAKGMKEAPWPSVVALSATAALTVLLFFWPDVFLDLARAVVAAGGRWLVIPAVGPILVLLGFALLLPVARGRRVQAAFSVAAGVIALALLAFLRDGDVVHARIWGLDLTLVSVTSLKLVFAWAFGLALLAWGAYAWPLEDPIERAAGLVYAGCAFGVVFAGDLLTLFLFWEGMAVASTVVVLRGRTEASFQSAYRYLIVHVLGGVLLYAGIDLYAGATGSWAFESISTDQPGAWLILVGFAVNAAAWPVAAWVPDAYPNASPTGTILLGTFTTKTAVLALLIGFAGADVLMLLGAMMAIYAVIYALGTRNLRRLLAYSLVGQVGYMLCAAGAGGDLGVSGAASHAFMHVMYKSLLFMAAGAVIVQTGSEVGGLARGLKARMPWTFGFAAVGAAAICAVPLTNAYVSKALILDSLHASEVGLAHLAEWALLIASAAAPLYVGLRFLWLAFYGDGDDVDVSEAQDAPLPQRIAMGGLALLCLVLGVWSAPVLQLLVIPEDVHVYSAGHVGKQLLLLAIGTVAFFGWRALRRRVTFPHPDPLPDTDAIYWRLTAGLVALIKGPLMVLFARWSRFAHHDVPRALAFFARNPAGFARLSFERVRLGATGLVGSPAEIDAAQRRYERHLGRFRRTPPAAAWPIGRTVFFGIVLLAIYVLVHVLT